MVTVHSYVSLPEGISTEIIKKNFTYKPIEITTYNNEWPQVYNSYDFLHTSTAAEDELQQNAIDHPQVIERAPVERPKTPWL